MAGNQRTTPDLTGAVARISPDLTREQQPSGTPAGQPVAAYYTVRISLPWYAAQRRRGAFTWEPSDTMIARMAAEGITVLPTLAGTPRWVAGKPTTPPVADEEAKDAWQTFVTAVVRRYGRDGVFWRSDAGEPSPFQAQCGCDAPPAPITAVQIWNEPNLRKYFTPIRSRS